MSKQVTRFGTGAASWRFSLAIGSGALVALCMGVGTASAGDGAHVCSATAQLQFEACHAEVKDDLLTARAICINVGDEEERSECIADAREERSESRELCAGQRTARLELCGELGEGRYEPDMDPAGFQDPRNLTVENPYFPLDVGNRWVFEEEDERIEIEVLDKTKRAEEIDCIVVNDKVFIEDRIVEDTDDWFGVRTDGSVVYCGEAVQDFEFFEGDDPEEAELVEIEGSFKTGVDGAKSGTTFPGVLTVGQFFRQEWHAGNAEDVGQILSTTYKYGVDPVLDAFVPQALAELMCGNADCVVIADTSTLDPDAFEHKFYARDLGKFLETKPNEGEFVPLVDCNFDPRCDLLP